MTDQELADQVKKALDREVLSCLKAVGMKAADRKSSKFYTVIVQAFLTGSNLAASVVTRGEGEGEVTSQQVERALLIEAKRRGLYLAQPEKSPEEGN